MKFLSALLAGAFFSAFPCAQAQLSPPAIYSGTSAGALGANTGLILNQGDSAFFAATPSGSGSLSYQWKKDGMNLPAQTGSTLVLENLRKENIGYYTVTVESGGTTATSCPVSVGINGVAFGAWQGLAAYYKFSGDATDATDFANDGTAVNVTPALDRFGNPNQAFQFNGSTSYVGWPDSVFGPDVDGFTFSMWATCNQTTAPEGWYLMNHGAINGEAAVLSTGTSYAFQVLLTDATWHKIEAPAQLGTYYVTVVYERGKRLELYLNGQLAVSQVPPNFPLAAKPYLPNPSSIGAYRSMNPLRSMFPGVIDDVRIYTRALSASDIQSLYFGEAFNAIPIPAPPAPGTISSGTSFDTVSTGTSLTLNPGGSAYFSVTVPPPVLSGTWYAVQWQKDGMNLPGQTSTRLVLNNLKPENIGYYTAVISSVPGNTKIASTSVALGLNGIPFGAWQGLVAYYKFSGDASDSSGLGNDGTAVNAAGATDRYGIPNQAFHFNGSSSYVGWPDAIISPQTAGFTMSMWVKPDRAKASGEWCLINHGAINGEGGLNTTGNTYEFQVKLSDASFCKTAWVPHNLGLVHLVGVYERGTRVQLWINGELASNRVPQSMDLFAAPYLPNPSSIGAARDMTGVGVAFPGVIDDVKIFNRALAESEVQALFGQEAARETGNSTSVVVSNGGTAADVPNTRFVSVGCPATNNQLHVAFAATLAGTNPTTAKYLRAGNSGIWADDSSGVRHLMAFEGRTAPGANGAKFKEFADPVINNTEVIAFNATLAGAGVAPGNANGIWSTEGGALHLIARQRQQAPGCGDGVVFQSFNSFVLPDQGGSSNTGGVILFAELAGPGVNLANDKGIWAVATNGNLELIVREGDIHPITGKAIRKLEFLPRVAGLGDGQTRGFAQGTGDFLYKAEFADGSWGVYQSVFP